MVHTNQDGGARASRRSRTARVHRHHEDRGAASRRSTSTGATPPSAARAATRRSPAPRSGCSRFREPGTAGIRRISAPSSGTCTTAACADGDSIRVFPLSNWTELDIWRYIHAENIPVVPLYFAEAAPGRRRATGSIMVDDDRLPLKPGEKPHLETVRFRIARLLSAHAARRVEADDVAEIIEEMLRTAPPSGRPRHRRRRRRLDGEQEARRVFLMAASRPRRRRRGRAGAEQRSAALHHLRLGRRRQVHADRPAADDTASVSDDQLSARATTRRCGRHPRARSTSRCCRRPAGRARAGHHHRRRLPLLPDLPPAQFIVADRPGHEQYTRNMAVAALDRRRRRRARRRHEGHPRADPPAPHDLRAAWACDVIVAVNKMDAVGLQPRGVRRVRRRGPLGGGPLRHEDVQVIPVSALTGDNVIEPSAEMAWYHGPTVLEALTVVATGRDRGPHRGAVPAARAVHRAGRRLPRLRRHRRRRHGPPGRQGGRQRQGRHDDGRAGARRRQGRRRGRRRRGRRPDAGDGDRRHPRRPGRRPRRGSRRERVPPPGHRVRRRPGVDRRGGAAARPLVPAAGRLAAPCRPWSPRSATGATSSPARRWRRAP